MTLTLTRAELREFSGRYRKSTVIAWLHARQIPYILDADGWPKVLRAAILDQRSKTQHSPEPQLRLQ